MSRRSSPFLCLAVFSMWVHATPVRTQEARPDSSAYAPNVEDVAAAAPLLGQVHQGQGGAPRHVQPDWLAGRRQGGVGEAEAQRLRYDLGSGGGAQELTAAAGAPAGPAAHGLGVLQARLRSTTCLCTHPKMCMHRPHGASSGSLSTGSAQ